MRAIGRLIVDGDRRARRARRAGPFAAEVHAIVDRFPVPGLPRT